MTSVASLGLVAIEAVTPVADTPAGPGFAMLIAALAPPAVAAVPASAPGTPGAPAGDGDGPVASGDDGADSDTGDIDVLSGPPPAPQPVPPPLPLPIATAPDPVAAAVAHTVAAAPTAEVPPGRAPGPTVSQAAPNMATARIPAPEDLLQVTRPDTLRPRPGTAPPSDVELGPVKRVVASPAASIAAVAAAPAGSERALPPTSVTASPPVSGATPAPTASPLPAATPAVAANPAAPATPVPAATLPPTAPLRPTTDRQPREAMPKSVAARDQRRGPAPLLDTGGGALPLAAAAAQPAALLAAPPSAMSAAPQRAATAGPATTPAAQVAEQAPGSFAVVTDRLGPVQVMLDARDARVSVQFAADTPAAGQLLAAHPSRLADAVAAGGQRLDALAVDVRSGGGQQQGRPSREPRPAAPPAAPSTAASRAARADRFA